MKTGQVEPVCGPGAAGAGSAGLFQVCRGGVPKVLRFCYKEPM
jgi:hypothetical protein